jgi:hypothetical protein
VGGPGNIGGVGRPGSSILPGLGLGAAGGYLAGKSGDIIGRRQDRVQDRRDNLGDRSENRQDRVQDRRDNLGENRQDRLEERRENLNNRSENLQDRLGQRQDYRQQRLEDRQDYLENRREDWANWHDDYYSQYDDWYHGGWSDNWGDYWDHTWGDNAAAALLGTTLWGLNRMGYWFGTEYYENPYYSEPLVLGNTTIDYSQPLAAPPTTVIVQQTAPTAQAADLPPGATPQGLEEFEAARTAFYAGDYPKALTMINQTLAAMPKDAVAHEFRALVLFALGKYHDAAATLHPVLAVGPGWDWTTMSGLYPSVDTYTTQLRALEQYVTKHDQAADARFVLAYHYLTLGHDEQAVKQLARIQKTLPGDSVTAQLLQMMGQAESQAAPEAESTAKIDVAQLLGTWTAKRGSKATFELTLDKDKSFKWVYREGKKREEISGAYALDGDVLALEPDAGGVMLAEISTPQDGAFDFRTAGAPKSDKGLRFQKK